MGDSSKISPKLHRHKSSCTITLRPITVPAQKQVSSPKPSITVSNSSSTSLSYLSDVPSSCESEAESFHSSVSHTKAPSQSAVASVRTMTENFQKLLSQATSEIKKLKRENQSIELEQNNLLDINEELSRETGRLESEENSWEVERKDLLKANEEFVDEVKKLYLEEEQWKLETQCLLDKRKRLEEEYRKDKDDLDSSIIKERALYAEQLKQLNHSIDILSMDNTVLKEDIASKIEQSLKTEEELREEFDKEKIILDETISKEREELRIGREDREKGEQQLEQLSQELDTVDMELAEVKRVNAENEFQMKESYERKVSQIDARIHKLRLENTKYDQENEDTARQVEELESLENKMRLEIKQIKVENQWLISNQKTNAVKEQKAEELKRELGLLRNQLKEEKNKVRDITEWKAQLMETNEQMKAENRRLLAKAEELENLVNAEATDIDEVLHMINGMQIQSPNGRRHSDQSKYDKKYF